LVSPGHDAVTVGVDIGTTSVKALAVDEDGKVVAQSRVPHTVVAPEPDHLRHDARKAWHAGPKKAYAAVLDQLEPLGRPVAGVTVAAMVPSLTAVNRRGVPLLPGLLYGDVEGRPDAEHAEREHPIGTLLDTEGFLRWAIREAPDAHGYWPGQAVATYALSGVPAIDTGVSSSMGALHHHGNWNAPALEAMGACEAQMPQVFFMGHAAGTLPGSDTVFGGGSIDALCDQVVAGANEPGDVLVIFGATLIVWAVTLDWLQIPGLISYPHTTADRFLVGGPSNAGALFADWARRLLRGVPRPGPDREKLPPRLGEPGRVPVWLPYIRGERTPLDDHSLRSNLYGLDIGTGPEAMERAAFEASGFVIRRMLDMAGVPARRIVASGGGSRVTAWMSAVADATNLPVDAVQVPDGGARGAAYFARMAAGLETSLDRAAAWAATGRRIEPDPAWVAPTAERYARFAQLGAAG
jgi:xylulokinase